MSTPNSRQAPKRKSPDEVKRIATELADIQVDKDLYLTTFLSSFSNDEGLTGTQRKAITKLVRSIDYAKEHGTIGNYKNVLETSLTTLQTVTDRLRTETQTKDEVANDPQYETRIQVDHIRDIRDLARNIQVINDQVVPKMQALAAALGIELTEPSKGTGR